MKKQQTAIIYARSASGDRYELADQLTGCLDEARRRGLKVLHSYEETGADDLPLRPRLVELLTGQAKQPADYLIVPHLDCLSHDPIEQADLVAHFTEAGTSLINVDSQIGAA